VEERKCTVYLGFIMRAAIREQKERAEERMPTCVVVVVVVVVVSRPIDDHLSRGRGSESLRK